MRTPIYTALQNYRRRHNWRLHMPGHAGCARGLPSGLKSLAAWDFTELPGLDDWHAPWGIIQESEKLLAEACGAAGARWLVNGSSSGLMAALTGQFNEQSRVLLPRNAHRSVLSGLIWSGAWPVYAPVTLDHYGLQQQPTAAVWATVCAKYDDIDGLLLTSPDYYGIPAEVAAFKTLAATRGAVLIVDEAHGSHFSFSGLYPPSALDSGADIVVQGWHKNLPVFNQGGALLWNLPRRQAEKIQLTLSNLTTTSPSYPLLAALDWARAYMLSTEGQALMQRAWELAQHYRRKIQTLPGLYLYGSDREFGSTDPLKCFIILDKVQLTGYQAASILQQRFHIDIELAQEQGILAMFSLFHDQPAWEAFYQALSYLCRVYSAPASRHTSKLTPPLPQVAMTPRQAVQTPSCKCYYRQAVHKVSASMIIPYPPGIPCLIPGEVITEEIVDYLAEVQTQVRHIQGGTFFTDGYLEVIENDCS